MPPAEATEELTGEWLVTTPMTLATAKRFEAQIAAAESPQERARLVQVRDLNIRRVAPIVKVNSSHMGFHTQRSREFRKYVVLRATAHEIEIQLEGDGGGRFVLTRSGNDELHAPGLAGFATGATWRRAGTPGVGQ